MSDYNYCHGPNCHTYHTQSRIRGVKGNKVLITRKFSRSNWQSKNDFGTKYWDYFCDDRCKHDFLDKHLQTIVNLEQSNEPLETPVDIVKVEKTGLWGNYIDTQIIERT